MRRFTLDSLVTSGIVDYDDLRSSSEHRPPVDPPPGPGGQCCLERRAGRWPA